MRIARLARTRGALILCSVLTLLSAAMSAGVHLFPSDQAPLPPMTEKFVPELRTIDSLDEAESYIRAGLKPDATQSQTADAIERFVSERFIHDTGKIRRGHDWVAWLAGALIWENLSFTTRPNDMLKTRRGICSQQTMLMQALLKRFEIEYSTVGFAFPAHMFVGAKVDGRWAVYDPDGEPTRERTVYYSEMGDPLVLKSLYGGKSGNPRFGVSKDLGEQFAHGSRIGAYEIKWVNQNPAPQATLFHHVTSFLSQFVWLFFACAALMILIYRSRAARLEERLALQVSSRPQPAMVERQNAHFGMIDHAC